MFSGIDYALKPFDYHHSLSRCDKSPITESINFKPEMFEETEISPNGENLCDGGNYLLSGTTFEVIEQVVEEIIVTEFEGNICTNEMIEEEHETIKFNEFRDKHDILLDYEFITTKFFDHKWIELINTYQKDLISDFTVLNLEIQEWFEYIFNETDPHMSRYRCRICYNYIKNLNETSTYRTPKIVLENGQLSMSKLRNGVLIREHTNLPRHKNVIRNLENRNFIVILKSLQE